VFRTCGDTRREEITRADVRDKVEFRAKFFRTEVGDPVDVRTDTFFFIDRGSTLPGGAELPFNIVLGVVSVLPVETNGCRLLLGRGDAIPSRPPGVESICVVFTRVVSEVELPSMEGKSIGHLCGLLTGIGEGHLGPSGRRSEECWDVERL
jgi:hypothetical protein